MFYAQLDAEKIVYGLSELSGAIEESHPMYDCLIPIREFDMSLLQKQNDEELIYHKFVELDSEGYGIFEEVSKPLPEIDDDNFELTQDEVNASILLNQAKIMKTQQEQDETMANILLNQIGGK